MPPKGTKQRGAAARRLTPVESRAAIARPAPVEVAAALIFRAGKLLITQRHAAAHLGGLWEFPGGKREPGETYKACLVREIREELGVEIVAGECLAEVSHAYPEKRLHLKFYRATLTVGEPQPLDCAALQWITRASLDDFAFPEADRQVIAKLKRSRRVWA
jgi:mutator protein MutT